MEQGGLRHRGTTDQNVGSKVSAETPAPKPPASDESMLRKMMVRSVVGVLMIAFFYWLCGKGVTYFTGFVIFGQLVTWKEVVSLSYKVHKENHLWGFRTLNWFWMFVAFFWCYSKPILQALPEVWESNFPSIKVPNLAPVCEFLVKYNDAVSVAFYVAALMLFVWSLQEKTLKYQINQLAWTIVSLLLVVGQAQFVIKYAYQGLLWFFLPHGLIVVNDIMAYYCGVFLGKKIINRPLTSLSPRKTWEGFVGALICTLIFAFMFTPYLVQPGSEWLYCPHHDPHCDRIPAFVKTTYRVPEFIKQNLGGSVQIPNTLELYPLQLHAIILALFASLVAPFGGFLASAIKRAYEAKDYAALFPGHGGFMDRVDCQFMMCTFTYVYLKTFIYDESQWLPYHD